MLVIIGASGLVNKFAWAEDGLCSKVKPIQFADHSNQALIHGAVVQGETACLSFRARAGQKTEIVISSDDGAAVFQFYQPGWHVGRDDGDQIIQGIAYPNAADGDDARAWRGVLAASGNQLIAVGATNGDTDYTLKLSIEP